MPRKGCQWQPKLEFDYRYSMDNIIKEMNADIMFYYSSYISTSLNATNPLTQYLKPAKVSGKRKHA